MMKMNITTIMVSAVLQVGLFTAIPFAWWLVTARRHQSFLSWLGLKKPVIEREKRFYLQLLSMILLFTPAMRLLYVFVDTSDAAASQFSGQGVSVLVPAIATGGMGGFMGWINEKKAGGSILPSCFIHGCANLASSIAAMASII